MNYQHPLKFILWAGGFVIVLAWYLPVEIAHWAAWRIYNFGNRAVRITRKLRMK